MITFQDAIATLTPADMVQVAREARPSSEYALMDFLPDELRPGYDVGTATMTIKPTMAGMVGTDSVFPPGGAMEIARFMQRTAKLAISIPISEEMLRDVQAFQAAQIIAGATVNNETVVEQAFGFYRGVVLQSLWDRKEWLRGQALGYGAIQWRFGDSSLSIDYGLPTGNRLPERTIANGDAYHLTGSKFWDDVRAMQKVFRVGGGIVGVLHPDTIDAIITNSANDIFVASDADGVFRLRRYANIKGNTQLSDDARDSVTLMSYGQGGEIIDPDKTDGTTKIVNFFDPGRIAWVGRGVDRGWRVTQGARPDPANDFALGYYHVAPTVEGGGVAGAWGRLLTPQDYPWMLRGEAVENGLPVILNPKRLVIAVSEMPE